ncbi:N-acetylmuramoyl-L-alanine amidase [Methylovulum sp.]|uniref:N-acetylmuramoyl-L-alanine amidase n=1 Tax=Methylovulum sp. TaxID=1916980 RepID=UPI0026058FAA|nr:N-acetylmuramoyl-L-alanine amidase [Methylovulum sp.]MDD5124975.1 N-acetylmuramoyl-L-alanine amidase [Methylovulum sp.]
MKNYYKIMCFFGLQLLQSVVCHAQPINVTTISYPQMQVAFTVSATPKHRFFVLDNPSRLVIDIKNATLSNVLTQPSSTHLLFSKVRVATRNNTDLRFIVDLKSPLASKNLILGANNKGVHQLIINLKDKKSVTHAEQKKIASKTQAKKPSSQIAHPVVTKQVEDNSNTPQKNTRAIVIAIDAGHGGNDPGAHGTNGTEEKTVTLAIARRLESLINRQPGMKAVMVRTDDYYIGLKERMQIARTEKADLFISIHADAFEDSSIKGASIYTLSRGAASSQAAEWLAKSENAADLIGGISLSDKEDVLASVLLDLSQTATQEASVAIATKVLKSFEGVADLHKNLVQKAGFVVLKSPDVPSILIETAFISNPSEEQNLLSTRYQEKMATAIFKGVFNYFKQSAPFDSKFAKL